MAELKKIHRNIPNEYLDELYYTRYDIRTFYKELMQYANDILFGKFENDNISFFSSISHLKYDKDFSNLMLKIKNQLHIDEWIDTDGYNFIKDENALANFPNVGFHGTSSKYLTSIRRLGLRYDQSETNWKNITQNANHRNTIFFSSGKMNALFHANKVFAYHNIESTLSYYPIIVEFIIPSKEYIVQDFDVERMTGNTDSHTLRYTKPSMVIKTALSNKPLPLSKEFGIYGYAGHILPKYIQAIWVPKLLNKNSVEYGLEDFIRLMPKDASDYFSLI